MAPPAMLHTVAVWFVWLTCHIISSNRCDQASGLLSKHARRINSGVGALAGPPQPLSRGKDCKGSIKSPSTSKTSFLLYLDSVCGGGLLEQGRCRRQDLASFRAIGIPDPWSHPPLSCTMDCISSPKSDRQPQYTLPLQSRSSAPLFRCPLRLVCASRPGNYLPTLHGVCHGTIWSSSSNIATWEHDA